MLGPTIANCSLAKTFKILLLFCGVLFFYEYFLDARRTSTFYTSSVLPRTTPPVRWPKRTQSRHCFDGVTDPPPPPPPSAAVNSDAVIGSSVAVIGSSVATEAKSESVLNPNAEPPASTNMTKLSESDSLADGRSSLNNSDTSQALDANDSLSYSLKEASSTALPTVGCSVTCPAIPPGLVGPVQVNSTELSLQELEKYKFDVAMGGHYAPRECKPRYKVALVIPYRDREAHLAIFLNNMHPFLMKQQIEYRIYVIEQKGKGKFNRATLMNVGFVEALKEYPWDCFIFHDVDLLPLDDRNLYTCPTQPRHLSAAIDKFQFKLPYSAIFGGVSALTTEQFKKVNGFSNNFWGWGGEDDDMANRIGYHSYHISRYPMSIARYTMLSHDQESPNPKRYEALTKGKKVFDKVGLNNLQYTLVEKQTHSLHTLFLVELHPPS